MAVLTGFVVLLYGVTCASGNIIDLTCFTPTPTVDREGNDEVIIGGYKSGADTDIEVEFGRESFTDTGNGLPSASEQYVHSRGKKVAELLRLPGSVGSERIGAFYCQATKYGITERIVTTILASFTENRYVTPDQISITANMGESVTLSVTPKDHVIISALRWRLNNGDTMWNGQKSQTISSVSNDDAGVYECHTADYRNGNHAIMQLIVRGCVAGRWGKPTCSNACPRCYNGGICDDRSGLCVCAPGFSGTNCQTVHGSNRWSQDGQSVCSRNHPHSAACRGKLFCLPHPYGCTCAAGYYGIDCNQECEEGTYGANCRSQCHCADGVSCLQDTGECNDGQCHPNWYGVNCQVPCPDQGTRTVTNLQGQAAATNIAVQWEPETGPCSYFVLTYDVSDNLERCREVMHSQEYLLTSNQFEISNLQYYSTYTITVTIRGSHTSDSVTVITRQTVPAFLPSVSTTVERAYTGLTFFWNQIPCESIRGPGFHYTYRFQNEVGTTDATSVPFSDLISCTEYQFEVWAVNRLGAGEVGNFFATTRTIVPGPVNNLLAAELQLFWQPSTENPCKESGYIITFELLNKDQCEIIGSSSAQWSIADPAYVTTLTTTLASPALYPYSSYNVSVQAQNTAGSSKSMYIVQTTNTAKPSAPPSNITVGEMTSDTLAFQWSEPPCGTRHGKIVSYLFSLTNDAGTVVQSGSRSSSDVMIENLTPFTGYMFQVAAVTDAGEGPLSDSLSVSTKQAAPSNPTNLRTVEVTRYSINMTWDPPEQRNGIIEGYSVASRVVAKPYDSDFVASREHDIELYINDTMLGAYTFVNLSPSTKYELQVFAHNAGGKGLGSSVQIFTAMVTVKDISKPPMISSEISDDFLTSTTVQITIPLSKSEYVTGYQVGVESQPPTIQKRQTKPNGSESFHVAAEITESDIDEGSFIIGDDKTYGMFNNRPLSGGQTYTLYTAYVSRINNTSYVAIWSDGIDVTLPEQEETSPASQGAVIPIICVVVVLILIVAIIAAILLKKFRKGPGRDTSHGFALSPQTDNSSSNERGAVNNAYVATPSSVVATLPNRPPIPSPKPPVPTQIGPIKLTALEKYVNTKKGSHENSFKVDFQTLPGENIESRDAAKKPENKKKNRYANITTYDKARVVLEQLENDPNSDYINASYIDGVYETKKCIASQGPNITSLHDFWRMIWQYKIKKIVMLTNLVESGKVKCEKYWPDKVTAMGDVIVTPIKEEEFADYFIRSFLIKQESTGEVRELRQYHYTSWPDMGVPNSPAPVLNFMRLVNDYTPDDSGPPVIHCSAGVGRTGTYITIDAMMERGKREGAVDVFGFVSNMRQNRMHMVQTSEQYRFIFDALLDDMHCGDTSYLTTLFESEFSKLSKVDRKTGKSGLMKQFEALEKLTTWPDESKYNGGTNPLNVDKNRFQDILPTDSKRPYLMTEVDENSTNYINAAYIDSDRERGQHIATQIPLPETIADIWRMVYDYKFSTIVMMNTLDYKDPNMAKYWPDEKKTATFGPFHVTCIKAEVQPHDVTVRTFSVSNDQDKSGGERTIRLLSLCNWPAGDDEPRSVDSVIALITNLTTWKEQCGSERVVVQCIDGVGASCAFCAILLVLQRLQYDDEKIDVFQAIRILRMSRPQAVRNLAQYTFCYKAIAAHLSSEAIYVNM